MLWIILFVRSTRNINIPYGFVDRRKFRILEEEAVIKASLVFKHLLSWAYKLWENLKSCYQETTKECYFSDSSVIRRQHGGIGTITVNNIRALILLWSYSTLYR